MTKTLSQITTAAQALLLDDGTRYSAATIEAATRSALQDFNRIAPVFQGELADVVSGQKEYSLNTGVFGNLIDVVAVLKQGSDSNLELNTELPCDFYFEDASPFIRLRSAQTSGHLIVRYTIPHTISGLDSAIESTIPAYFDNTIIDGACYYSCLIRANARIEAINLNANVADQLQKTMLYYAQAFQLGLTQAARRSPPVSEPNTSRWPI